MGSWANLLAIIVVILITILGQLRLNAWNRSFYEHIEAFNRGAIDQKPKLLKDLRNVLRICWRIVNANARLTFVTAAYGWLTTIAPILAAAPGYFGGNLTFGELMGCRGVLSSADIATMVYR
jgi:ABC-type uncharacterized transport system fused permease/ATPase subunit